MTSVTTTTWQCGWYLRVTKCIGTQRLAAVRTIPFGAACGHLSHADALEMKPLFVALHMLAHLKPGIAKGPTLLSHDIIDP